LTHLGILMIAESVETDPRAAQAGHLSEEMKAMQKVLPVTWSLDGDVNSEQFTLAGSGSADLTCGATELRLSAAPQFPTGFDPALSQMMCNFTLAGYTAVPAGPGSLRDAVGGNLFVRPRRQVVITDSSGESLVRLEALTTMTVTDDAITVTNLMTGFSRLSSAVVRAYGTETLIPGEPGAATGMAQFRVELADGQVLDGMTVVPYRFDRLDATVTLAVRSIEDHTWERTSPTDVILRAVSHWRELAPAMLSTGV
jgi:hypothetical protein